MRRRAPAARVAGGDSAAQRVAYAPAPASGTRITEGYARMVAREIYFWAWPMINMYNRRLAFAHAPDVALLNGVLPVAPLNRLAMLHDYIEPGQRWVACPNQDVVDGVGIAALDETPVIVQVPDFGTRFWVYQVLDLRTDSFAELGAMYDTRPGFYLIANANWTGQVPSGVLDVFRSPTGTALIAPRVFQDDTQKDKRAVQDVIAFIDMYPLSKYDGKPRLRDWSKLPTVAAATGDGEPAETRWVFPETFLDQLPAVLADAPPLPGEETRYAEAFAIVEAARKDPVLRGAMIDEATRCEQSLIDPLRQFRNFGVPLPYHWTTVNNGAQFGNDYFMRTAIARSNILVNSPGETRYYYQDLDRHGARLNGACRYTMTFREGELPPVDGFWSLTLYDGQHFFAANQVGRYAVGTKTPDLALEPDGSLTVYIQSEEPADPRKRANWLPAPADDFSLFLRAYGPRIVMTEGRWTPPPVIKQQLGPYRPLR